MKSNFKTTVYDVEQGSDEWSQLKLGKLSASKGELLLVAGDEIITDDKGKSKKVRRPENIGSGLQTLITEKYTEMLTLEPIFDGFSNKDAQWGIDTEPLARREFERRNMMSVVELGFVEVDEHYIGYSPDFEIPGIKEGGEIKCYASKNHIEIVRTGIIPKKVIAQCQFSMMINDFNAWNVVFYDPRLIEPLQYKQFKLERNEDMIDLMRAKSIKCSDIIKNVLLEYNIGDK